jgi:hypothetical protein
MYISISKKILLIFLLPLVTLITCKKDPTKQEEKVCENLFLQRNNLFYLISSDSMGVIEGFGFTRNGKKVAKVKIDEINEFAYIKKSGIQFTGKVGNIDIKGSIGQGRRNQENRTFFYGAASTLDNNPSDLTYKILYAINYCTCYTQIDDLGYYYYQPRDSDKHNLFIMRTIKKPE